MEFKRFYVKDADGNVVPNPSTGGGKVSHLRVRRATKRWLASPSVLEQGFAEGYFSLKDGELTIKTAEGEPDVVYKVVTPPGWYCCHCGKRIGDSKEGAEHVKLEHPGLPSPDDNNPSGWRRDNHYTLEFVSGTDVKPEVDAGGRLRYFAQQEARRDGARKKIAQRDARAAAASQAEHAAALANEAAE